MAPQQIRVAVYCSSSIAIDQRHIELAMRVGEAIAKENWELVWGGGKVSMMGSVARGARNMGGRTLGVIPTKLRNVEFFDDEASEIYEVSDMRQRKAMIEEFADAFIALPGGLGTLEELFEIWVGRFLGFHKKPIAVIDPDGVYKNLLALLGYLKSERFMKPGQEELVLFTSDISSAINYLDNELKGVVL